jgi:hypothetical protein
MVLRFYKWLNSIITARELGLFLFISLLRSEFACFSTYLQSLYFFDVDGNDFNPTANEAKPAILHPT